MNKLIQLVNPKKEEVRQAEPLLPEPPGQTIPNAPDIGNEINPDYKLDDSVVGKNSILKTGGKLEVTYRQGKIIDYFLSKDKFTKEEVEKLEKVIELARQYQILPLIYYYMMLKSMAKASDCSIFLENEYYPHKYTFNGPDHNSITVNTNEDEIIIIYIYI